MTSDLLEENQELRKEIAKLRSNSFTISAMTEEIKKKFDEWIKENGGTGGVLYQTFSDDELEHIFMSAYAKNNR